jgi:hypothetical protein
MDDRFSVYGATRWRDWYVLTVRKDLVTAGNNYLLVCHLPTRRWFLLEESVYDVTVWGESLVGVEESIFELFRGNYPNRAAVSVHGLVPQSGTALGQRSLVDLRLLMEPSSVEAVDVTVDGEFGAGEGEEAQFHTLPSKAAAGRVQHPATHWKTKFLYSERPPWLAPRDVWISAKLKRSVPGFAHGVKLEFPAGHRVRLKALGLSFGADLRGSGAA